MKKLIVVLLVVIFMLTSCGENGNKVGSGGVSESMGIIDNQIICDKSLKVLPIDKPIVMKIQERLSFGRKLYAVYPARTDPVEDLERYTYDGRYSAENTHDLPTSIKHNVIETFDVISEMAKKGVVVTPQVLATKFRVTLTHYSENSNPLQVYVRAKGSADEWKIITLGGVGTTYEFVETNANGELEYYLEESSYYDWIDDETAEPGFHVYGYIEANIEIDEVYLPFK